jgi:hypothetical protein
LITFDDLSEIIALCPIGCQSRFVNKKYQQVEISPLYFDGVHPSRCDDYQVKYGSMDPLENGGLYYPIKGRHSRIDK